MKWRIEYLSEEELKMLISEVEQNDMVAAPPDMAESILTSIEAECQNAAHILAVDPPLHVQEASRPSAEYKRKEFWNYCFRVWTYSHHLWTESAMANHIPDALLYGT